VTVVWLVINSVNVLQAIGFATRPFAPGVNPALGLVIAPLAIPATWALLVFLRLRAGWRFIAGPLVFDAFVILMLAIDYLYRIEWRDPPVAAIQVPYLLLFFGSILLMGPPMFRIDRRRWSVTAVTTGLLLASMLYATSMGVGLRSRAARARAAGKRPPISATPRRSVDAPFVELHGQHSTDALPM
jgi:hypothetical protein